MVGRSGLQSLEAQSSSPVVSHGVLGGAAHLSQATCHGSRGGPPCLLIPRQSVSLCVCAGPWLQGEEGPLTLAWPLGSFLEGDIGEG